MQIALYVYIVIFIYFIQLSLYIFVQYAVLFLYNVSVIITLSKEQRTNNPGAKPGEREELNMTLEEARDITRKELAPYYSNERIEEIVSNYVSVVRPGVVLVNNKNVGFMELYL